MMAKKLRVPDAPGGVRFCTACDSFRPVSEFPLGPRRYTCKTHMWANTGKKAKAKMMADTNTRILFRLWGKAYDDSKRFSRAWRALEDCEVQPKDHANVSITQREIEQLLCTATDYSVKGMYNNPTRIAKQITVVPVNPTEILSLSNAALVPNTVKRQLFRAWKLGGLEGYTKNIREAGKCSESVFFPSQEQIQMMRSVTNSSLAAGLASDHSSGGESEECEAENDCPLITRISELL